MPIKVTVPATSANIGPGYDVWGIALNLKNTFSSELDLKAKSLCEFEFVYSDLVRQTTTGDITIPNGEDNLFCKAYRFLFAKAKRKPLPIKVRCEVNIPLERGLGASSTAVLGGMITANEVLRDYYEEAYSLEQIFDFATDVEGHPDNIAPALYGGWILSVWHPTEQRYKIFPLKIEAPVRIAGVIPHLTLNTEKARSVVKDHFELKTVIAHGARMALLVHLLGKNSWTASERENFYLALEDDIHQKQRADFVPGMYETFAYWRSLGCYGAFLSGAGTTLLGFWQSNFSFENISLGKKLEEYQVQATPLFLEIDRYGVLVEKS